MKRDPAETVRLALAIANDARAPQGQRDAAVNRAMALIERHGLDPDRFDIPGRSRKPRRFHVDYTADEAVAMARAVRETVERAYRDAFSAPFGQSAHRQAREWDDALEAEMAEAQRAFHEAERSARQSPSPFPTAKAAADWLFAHGFAVYPTDEIDDSHWYVPDAGTTMTDAQLRSWAEEKAAARAQ